ncbi:MAG: hypothetical protein Q9217_003150 [Psora testacea]
MGKLIRLELFNFKSYKGHHVLLFGDSYFTSIIGPNGSGKSNSMDAISFVLGIKSSHLRSTHLRDLVFRGRVLQTSKINGNGSATTNGVNGHPDGDARYNDEGGINGTRERNDPTSAWVMAVYEDDAGDEQYWKRTITNQSASEYRINDRVVTALQYNEALEAENILIKARNFLVFQGDVEAIASQSPRDLTKLIEQISGSLEYKAEYETLKEQAELALENQNFALHRRRGINSEIKQYTDQKNEADNYTKKADERDQAIVTHILWKLYHFQKVIEESGAEIQRHQEELKEQRRGVEKYDKALEEAKKDQAKVGRDVSKIEKNIKQKEKEIEAKENGLVPIAEKIAITTKNLKQCTTRVAEISKEREIHSTSIKQLTKDLKVVEKAQTRWESDFRKAAEQEGRELSEADLQRYNRLKEELNKRTSADQIKVDTLTRQQKADEETVKSLKSKVDTLEWQLQKLQEELDEINERKLNTNGQIKQTTKDINAKKKAYNERTSERLRTAQLRTEKDEKLQEVLIKLLEAEDGRQQSEKELRLKATVADMKRIFPGVRGRVSELCKPIEKRFQTAVSTVLGRNFDAVIVENEKTAIECIQYLREQRRGQATFIPLDTIQFTAINTNIKGQHRGCRMALDTISYDRSFERAFSYVCGNSVVCDDLGIAKNIVWEKRNDVKAVTLDGSIIHKGGNMTGGQGSKQDSRRFDDAEIDNLRKLQERLVSELSALPDNRRGASEEETLLGELTGLEQRLTYLKEELNAHERNQSSKQKELSHIRQELATAKPKYEGKLREYQELESTLQSYQDAVSEVEDEVFADFCRRLGFSDIRAYEAQQGTLQQEGAQKRLEFSSQKTRLESRISYEQQQLQETKGRIKVLEERAHQDEALIKELETEQESSQNEIDTLSVELDQLTEQLEREKATHNRKAEKVAEQRRQLQKQSKTVDSILKTISGLEADRQLNASGRYILLRRCKLEDIRIPLDEDSRGLGQLPLDDIVHADPDAMDVDEDQEATTLQPSEVQDYGILIDFDDLDEDLRENNDDKVEGELQDRIKSLNAELETMAPNMRAVERLGIVQDRLKTTDRDFEDARKRAKRAKDDFQAVKEKRFELFSKAFSHISEQIGPVYKNLTRDASLPMGGQAYLDIEDGDEPYLDGIKYHAMPPLKRFRDMEHLSGGEKTMAALALLFAVHSYQPSPFFVLDEVDAALDNANVAKIANYIRDHAGPGMQFIVISLKTGLFHNSEALVGIYRDQGANSSKALTLDLRKYQ